MVTRVRLSRSRRGQRLRDELRECRHVDNTSTSPAGTLSKKYGLSVTSIRSTSSAVPRAPSGPGMTTTTDDPDSWTSSGCHRRAWKSYQTMPVSAPNSGNVIRRRLVVVRWVTVGVGVNVATVLRQIQDADPCRAGPRSSRVVLERPGRAHGAHDDLEGDDAGCTYGQTCRFRRAAQRLRPAVVGRIDREIPPTSLRSPRDGRRRRRRRRDRPRPARRSAKHRPCSRPRRRTSRRSCRRPGSPDRR